MRERERETERERQRERIRERRGFHQSVTRTETQNRASSEVMQLGVHYFITDWTWVAFPDEFFFFSWMCMITPVHQRWTHCPHGLSTLWSRDDGVTRHCKMCRRVHSVTCLTVIQCPLSHCMHFHVSILWYKNFCKVSWETNRLRFTSKLNADKLKLSSYWCIIKNQYHHK